MFNLLILVAAAASSTMTFDEAKVLADKYEAALPAAQADELKMSFLKIGRLAFSKCMPSPPLEIVPNFTVVMMVDATGKVQNTWLHDSTDFTKCVEGQFAVASLPKLPKSPYYTSFEFIFGSEP